MQQLKQTHAGSDEKRQLLGVLQRVQVWLSYTLHAIISPQFVGNTAKLRLCSDGWLVQLLGWNIEALVCQFVNMHYMAI